MRVSNLIAAAIVGHLFFSADCIRSLASAEELQLAGGSRWLVIASRKDLDDAVGIAMYYGSQDVRVIRARNGWFATIMGPFDAISAEAEKQKLASLHRLPTDAYFSRGEAYVETVWTPPQPPALDRKEFRNNEVGGLIASDLRVDLVWSHRDNKRYRFAVGWESGREIFRLPVAADDEEYAAPTITFARLDRSSAHRQVVITSFTGGAHCCTTTIIVTKRPDRSWATIDAGSLDGEGYHLLDLDNDGSLELLSVDNSFLYAFACYACSWAPSRISKEADGTLQDVTRQPQFQTFLRRVVRRFEFAARLSPKLLNDNGYLAGWVAAKILIGEGDAAWSTMLNSYDKNSDWGHMYVRLNCL